MTAVRRRPATGALAILAAALSWLLAVPTTGAGATPATAMAKVIVQGGAAAQTAVRDLGGAVTRDLPLVQGFAATLPAAAVGRLARVPGVAGLVPDEPITMHAAPPGTYNNVPSVYKKVTGGESLNSNGAQGQGVTVALIDTGVSPLPDIAGAIKPVAVDSLGLVTAPCVNFTDDTTCDDNFGHGTFMAGIIAGNGGASNGAYAGMAPRAKIVSLKIAGRSGASDVSTVIAALEWVVQHKDAYGIRAVNLSLGTDSTQSYHLDPLDYAVEQAWFSGIVVNVAASNRGPAAGTISKPADDPFVITVGALDDKGTVGYGDDAVPNFSGRGPTAADGLAKPDVVAPGAHIVSLAAPGATITTTYPSTMAAPYRRGSGTSMATAVVTGLVADMLSQDGSLSPDRIKYMLMSTAHSAGSDDPMVTGAGLVDGVAAFKAGPGTANVGVEPGLGTGSLAASRGTVGVILDDSNQTILDASSGDLTDSLTYLDTSGNSWWGNSWWGNSWWGNSWWGNSWWGNSWWGNSWWGQPDDVADYGNSWWGSAWYGGWDQ